MAQDYSPQRTSTSASSSLVNYGSLSDGFTIPEQNKPLWDLEPHRSEELLARKERQKDALLQAAVALAADAWQNERDELLGDGLNASGEATKTCVLMFRIAQPSASTATPEKPLLERLVGKSGGIYSKKDHRHLHAMRGATQVEQDKPTICGEEHVLMDLNATGRSDMLFSVAFDKTSGVKGACHSGCATLLATYRIKDISTLVSNHLTAATATASHVPTTPVVVAPVATVAPTGGAVVPTKPSWASIAAKANK